MQEIQEIGDGEELQNVRGTTRIGRIRVYLQNAAGNLDDRRRHRDSENDELSSGNLEYDHEWTNLISTHNGMRFDSLNNPRTSSLAHRSFREYYKI